MRDIYELGIGHPGGDFYIAGKLESNGKVNTEEFIEKYWVDGTRTFKGNPVKPVYLGMLCLSGIYDQNDLRKALAVNAGSDAVSLGGVVKLLLSNYERKIPDDFNAFHMAIGSTPLTLSLDSGREAREELYHSSVSFLKLEISQPELL